MLEQIQSPKKGEEIIVMHTTKGDISFRLFPEAAPKTVENFKTHCKNGYYDGVIFHRVIDEFMIQGGDPTGTGQGGESIYGKNFEDEFHRDYHNIYGALSMANAGPNTNGSQFFIVQKKDADKNILEQMREAGEKAGFSKDVVDAYEKMGGTPWLDFRHTVFGQVFDGMEVVESIAKAPRNAMDRPLEDIVIQSTEVKVF